MFLEYWKRKNANIAHHWEVMDYQEEEERPRPEYAARAPLMEKNPITGVIEPHFPPGARLRRTFTGFTILIIMVNGLLIPSFQIITQGKFKNSINIEITNTNTLFMNFQLIVVIIFVISVILYKCLINIVLLHSKNEIIHQEVSITKK